MGCCHDSVKEIANNIFSKDTFLSLIPHKLKKEDIPDWTNSLSQLVSLECMKEEMDNFQIRSRILELVSLRFLKKSEN